MAGRPPRNPQPPVALAPVPLEVRAWYTFLQPESLAPEQSGRWQLVRWYRRGKGRQVLADFRGGRSFGLRTVMISLESRPIPGVDKRVPIVAADQSTPPAVRELARLGRSL